MISDTIFSELEYYIRYGLNGGYKSRLTDEFYEIEFESSLYREYFKKLLEKERIFIKLLKEQNLLLIPRNQNITRLLDLLKLQRKNDLKESLEYHSSVIEFLSRNFQPILTSGREKGIIKFKMIDGGEEYALNELKELGFRISLENGILLVDISDTVKEMFKRISKVFDIEKMSPYYAFFVNLNEAGEKCKMLDELEVPYKYSKVHNEIYVDLDSLKHVLFKN
ncbi:conserved hypothetical protein [Methanococcus vannielii SB]|uniref:Uncharacterized protein n=1 Tax=Methanococcus vannielii (strain ATCC 35089 / DSM 1224 / JCM 13029 / OCM 148 / SB) TaxID=406327 RepID=A6UPL4_METVS|nr:hypothetical protein [Methanococcus vannielii]ABR54436.1 conserved hypothetical protein [Methanococcus vannielii SB]